MARIPVTINQGYIAMPPGAALPPLFMYHWARHNMDLIKGRANGSTFMEISKKAFRQIPLLVPPPKIVNRFVEHAQALFERIASAEGQAQSLAALRDTLLPRLISGHLRLPDTPVSAHVSTSLTDVVGGLENPDIFSGDPLAIQQIPRNEWQ